MATPALKRGLNATIDERQVAKRAKGGDANDGPAYPWKYTLHQLEQTDGMIYTERGDYTMFTEGFPFKEATGFRLNINEHSTPDKWPYYYARDRAVSNIKYIRTPEEDDLFRQIGLELDYTRLLPSAQRIFLQCYAPNNRALLALFFQSFDMNNKICGTSAGRKLIKWYCNSSSYDVQRKLVEHPRIEEIRTLEELDSSGICKDVETLSFFEHIFLSSTAARLAVPLPRGMVLFEGRAGKSAEPKIFNQLIRKEPFSTSWHPNVAMCFLRGDAGKENREMPRSFYGACNTRDAVFFVHKVMSDGVLGVDAQFEGPKRDTREYPHAEGYYETPYDECEIIVQPFVKIHLTEENVHLMQFDKLVTAGRTGDAGHAMVRTSFTHLYLGNECPCGHTTAPAPERGLEEMLDERIAKRTATNDENTPIFPWRYAVPAETSKEHLTQIIPKTYGFPFHEDDDAHMSITELDTADKWPYYYPRDRVYSNVNVDEERGYGQPRYIVKFTRLMLSTQRLFMQCYAPNNRALLNLFSTHFTSNKKICGTGVSSSALRSYCSHGFMPIRKVVHEYPDLDTINTLEEFHQRRDAVFRGATPRPPNYWMLTNKERVPLDEAILVHDSLTFFSCLFFPSPSRLAVPLPRGLVLFEGRAHESAETRTLKSTVRREVFSTTWHPNVAIRYMAGVYSTTSGVGFAHSFASASKSRSAVFFAHKVMSDGILGADAQNEPYRGSRARAMWHTELYEECEIVIQPFVKIHLVEECILLMQHNQIDTIIRGDHHVTPVYMRTIFTHLYLGDQCPCGHTLIEKPMSAW